jgi:hypothetical protein
MGMLYSVILLSVCGGILLTKLRKGQNMLVPTWAEIEELIKGLRPMTPAELGTEWQHCSGNARIAQSVGWVLVCDPAPSGPGVFVMEKDSGVVPFPEAIANPLREWALGLYDPESEIASGEGASVVAL